VEYRKATEDDMLYVRATFSKSVRPHCGKGLGYTGKLLRQELVGGLASADVICLAEGVTVLAWGAFKAGGAYWVYVPKFARGRGLCRKLKRKAEELGLLQSEPPA
jgi:hypothetical protein